VFDIAGKTFSSDLNLATTRASALKSAANTLQQSRTVDKDHKTTVNGNRKASEVIDTAHQTAQAIANSVNQASSQLQTVASKFEADDQQASRTLFGPLLTGGNK